MTLTIVRYLATATGVAASLLATAAPWAAPIVVVGRFAFPGWLAGIGLTVLAGALMWGPRLAPGRRAPRASDPKRRRTPLWLLVTLTVLPVTSALPVAGLDLLGTDYLVLDPVGPDGCRVAVRERGSWPGGSGEVFVVRGNGIGRMVGRWTIDDGGSPIRSGAYSLTWTGDDGVLHLWGGQGNPVLSGALHDVNCR